MDGRWIFYGLLSGTIAKDFNMGMLLRKRIELISTTLRNRREDFKSELISGFRRDILPYILSGQIVPVIERVVKMKWDEEGVK